MVDYQSVSIGGISMELTMYQPQGINIFQCIVDHVGPMLHHLPWLIESTY